MCVGDVILPLKPHPEIMRIALRPDDSCPSTIDDDPLSGPGIDAIGTADILVSHWGLEQTLRFVERGEGFGARIGALADKCREAITDPTERLGKLCIFVPGIIQR